MKLTYIKNGPKVVQLPKAVDFNFIDALDIRNYRLLKQYQEDNSQLSGKSQVG